VEGLRVLHVHDCRATLWAICREFVGSGSISFEGDLNRFALEDLPGSSHDETVALKRQTQWPALDFVVLPITLHHLTALQSRIEEEDLLGWEGAITHVQVENDGQLALSACDNFHDDATVAFTPPVSEILLAQLKADGVLRAVVTPNTSLERTREG
jgi:hypothetical protein